MAGRVKLLGRIGLSVDGGAGGRSLPGRRAGLAFAYLAAEHRRVVTQDELADALWPGTLPDSWASALRSVITEVRRFLEEAGLDSAEVLATARRGYRLQLPADVVVDLDEARDGLTRARALLDRGDGAAAASLGARSAALARLPFLPSHDCEWLDGIRRELDSIHARALEVEARGDRAVGDLTGAAVAAERLVRAEPFSEAGHQLRIRILGEAGDRGGAIKAYEHCKAVLASELGVAPSAETEAALQEAMQAVAAQPPPTTSSSPGGLSSGPSPLADLSVLVTEDHDFQRRTAVRLLRGLGVGTVAEAMDGLAALEILVHSPQPDVIICDIDMPGMDGVEFIRHVAERGLASAVVVASGLDSKVLDAVKALGEAKGLQVLGVLEKPLTPRRLAELLGTYRRQPAFPSPGPTVRITGDEVHVALTEGQIITGFESTADLGECRVRRAEAVGRWLHPAKGPVPPAAFLPVMESEGLGWRYAESMLYDACSALTRCRAAGLPIEIGVDVGPGALADVTLADRLLEAVRRGGAEPSEITMEVSEHTLRTAPPVALDVMTRIRVKGFGLAVDHFGTRRASLDHLAPIPLTEVKLDGSLVSSRHDGENQYGLEEAFEAAQSLRVPVVATGCDNEAAFDLLVGMGVRYVQGPFIGAAMNGAELVDCVRTWSPPGSG